MPAVLAFISVFTAVIVSQKELERGIPDKCFGQEERFHEEQLEIVPQTEGSPRILLPIEKTGFIYLFFKMKFAAQ